MKSRSKPQNFYQGWQAEPPQETYRDIPLVWQGGSEEELRRLTWAICVTEPDLFDPQETVTAVYRAGMDAKRSGFLYVQRRGMYSLEHYISPRLMLLCELAVRINACRGMRWVDCPGKSGRMQKMAIRIRISIDPPSAHEKAEALLTLRDWLDIALHDTRKRARFDLPPVEAGLR